MANSIFDTLAGVIDLLKPRDKKRAGLDTVKYEIDTPETEEQRIVSGILQMFDESRKDKRPQTTLWPPMWDMLIGNHWKNKPEATAYLPDITENYIFSVHRTLLNQLTAKSPTWQFVPRTTESNYQVARAVSEILVQWWERYRMRRQVARVVWNQCAFGMGFFYVYWDVFKSKICIESVDPENIFLNPGASSVADATFLMHVVELPIWRVLQMFPDSKDKIATGVKTVEMGMEKSYRQTGYGNTKDDFRYSGYASGNSGPIVPFVHDDKDASQKGDFVQVLSCWIRDPTMERVKVPIADPATGMPVGEIEVDVPKYPGGRVIGVAGNRVIHDAPNPYKHGLFPYVEVPAYEFEGVIGGAA